MTRAIGIEVLEVTERGERERKSNSPMAFDVAVICLRLLASHGAQFLQIDPAQIEVQLPGIPGEAEPAILKPSIYIFRPEDDHPEEFEALVKLAEEIVRTYPYLDFRNQ